MGLFYAHFIKFTILSLPIGKRLGFHVGAASNHDKCDLNDFISRQDAAPTNSGLAATFLSLNRFGKSIRVDSRIKFQSNFIDIENLKKNKRATGRPQDLADAENLESLRACRQVFHVWRLTNARE